VPAIAAGSVMCLQCVTLPCPSVGRFFIHDSCSARSRCSGSSTTTASRQGRAGALGGAVRRLRQRRAGGDRHVHLRRRGQEGPAERPGAAAPPFEGQGPRGKQRAHRAVPAALRRAHWQIVVPSTPAQYFHVLRRQAMSEVKDPLVVFTPKSQLRLKETSRRRPSRPRACSSR